MFPPPPPCVRAATSFGPKTKFFFFNFVCLFLFGQRMRRVGKEKTVDRERRGMFFFLLMLTCDDDNPGIAFLFSSSKRERNERGQQDNNAQINIRRILKKKKKKKKELKIKRIRQSEFVIQHTPGRKRRERDGHIRVSRVCNVAPVCQKSPVSRL